MDASRNKEDKGLPGCHRDNTQMHYKKRVSTAPEIPYTESGPQSPMAFAGARTTYHSGDGHVQVPYGH
ncbi:hypothetical protein EMIT0324P_60290 [Pseudomonas chlororaphis]